MSQSQKTLLMLLAFVAVAAGLGGWAYFGIYKGDQQVAKKQDHELRLFAPQKFEERTADGGAPPAEFTSLTITSEGKTTVLEREFGEPWRIVSPVKAKADRLVIDAVVSTLQSAKFKSTLEENPDDAALAKYGLKDPKFVVEARAVVNGEPRTVKLMGGIENTFDGSVFVRRNDEKPVFTAEGGVRFTLSKTTFDLREKRVLAVDETKVKRIATKSQTNAYELQRGDDKQWSLVKPQPDAADTSSVMAMVNQASGEKAQAFFEPTPENKKAFGFDSPFVTTLVTLADGQQVKLTVTRLGTEGAELHYALREDADGEELAQVTAGALQYDRNPKDLRDKGILRFQKELVTKLVFKNEAGVEIVVAKDAPDASAESWRVVAPQAGKAKIFKVTSALWMLSSTKALAAGEEKPDWKKYGINERSRSVTIYGDGDQELARFVVGDKVPNTPSAVWVRGSRDQVLQSDSSRFAELPFQLSDVLDVPDAGVTSP